MKLFSSFLICFFTLSFSIYAESFAKITFVDGAPYILRKLKKVSVKLGDAIEYKDQIITGKNDRVTIEDEKGHRVYVLQSSKLKIPSKKSTNIVLQQDEGSLWFKINPIKRDESFTVRTPAAVAGVRGTKFITMVLENKSTDLCVCEGEVSLNMNGNEQLVKTGEGSVASPNKKKASSPFNNRALIMQTRRLSRKVVCMNCHSGDGNYSSSSLEEDRLILR